MSSPSSGVALIRYASNRWASPRSDDNATHIAHPVALDEARERVVEAARAYVALGKANNHEALRVLKREIAAFDALTASAREATATPRHDDGDGRSESYWDRWKR